MRFVFISTLMLIGVGLAYVMLIGFLQR